MLRGGPAALADEALALRLLQSPYALLAAQRAICFVAPTTWDDALAREGQRLLANDPIDVDAIVARALAKDGQTKERKQWWEILAAHGGVLMERDGIDVKKSIAAALQKCKRPEER